jgi:uncharacterized lipoprotein (TIGR02269 family)
MNHRLISLLCALLMACSAVAPVPEAPDDIIEPLSGRQVTPEDALRCWEQGECAIFACEDGTCGFHLPQQSEEPEVGQVLQVAGPVMRPPPARRRSRARGPGEGPVFIIPWRRPPGLPRPPLPVQWSLRWERHHLFPQRWDLAQWFREKGVRIHDYTMILPHDVHVRIHSGGTRGGRWNEAWAAFKNEYPDARPEQIYRHLGKLLYEFELIGPIQPYWRRSPPPPEAPMGVCAE